MATTAPARVTPASRRSPSVSSTSTTSSIAKGATARSAVSPRVSSSLSSPAARRGSLKGSAAPPLVNGEPRETRESLTASLKQETEKKEQLLVQLQDKDQTIVQLMSENDSVTSALHSAESRLTELYADQSRMEEEMAARIEVVEKLRTQIRDLEKEKRDIQRRYNEQTTTFEAERQAFYDNEQHLKSRIQSLTQTRKQPAQSLTSPSVVSIAESETQVEQEQPELPMQSQKQDMSDPEQEPAEMTALKLELSTLSTSHASLQSTLGLLQTQLVDLKRVNNELQEENESYNILLREKTLNGQFHVLRVGGGTSVSEASVSELGEDDDPDMESRDGESLRSRNTGRSVLDPVDELAEDHEHGHRLDPAFEQEHGNSLESRDADEPTRNSRRHTRKHSSHSPAPRGESLANLPITGPGLDLAAELGRAENKDILEGRSSLDSDRLVQAVKSRKGRKASGSDTNRKVSSSSEPGPESAPLNDIDALRNEVKSLKDANKALSLYASKIIDRIISQEGFEHVLAVDYEKISTPNTAATFTTFSNLQKASPPQPQSQPPKKGRPQSAIFSFSSSPVNSSATTSPAPERLTTFNSPPIGNLSNGPPSASASTRASRRSMSFDWKSFSMFSGGEKKLEPSANLRPLTLRPGTGPTITGGRKLETHEDDEDRKERERLHATMKLMGIDKPPTPAMQKSFSAPSEPTGLGVRDANSILPPLLANTPASVSSPSNVVPPTPSSRFSFFRRTSSMTASDTSSVHSSMHGSPQLPMSGANTPNLTQEALEQAEAENTLAALDAHERQLSAEIAKGGGGGFTEIMRRSGDRRSSRKSGESGSTVWSAGMSKHEDGDD
ncbi:uncharacterized protein FIBRA_00994 [Fibroporia radiculosa]|uniref:Uncharacterized protein n=1 Tax=Fibroporia radiculosa TaxID=599839 RepID=J4I888_9APHY|nr:uncharacterized protein FIBRA_00994 [Fibroporia radiculosa]CCL98986.1 predicted protein [Fibroporia radiculosa]